jgi:hypothetical protein
MSKKQKTTATETTTETPVTTVAPAERVLTDPEACGSHNRFRSRVNRSTGVRINSYRPIAPGTTFVNICEAHGTVAHFNSRKEAKDAAYAPGGAIPGHEAAEAWCPGCAAILAERREAAAAAKAKAVEAATPA